MKLLASILLFCLAATAFGQNTYCRMKSVKITATRRVCQRSCIAIRGQSTVCATAKAGQTILLCPPTCCRMGTSCHQLYKV